MTSRGWLWGAKVVGVLMLFYGFGYLVMRQDAVPPWNGYGGKTILLNAGPLGRLAVSRGPANDDIGLRNHYRNARWEGWGGDPESSSSAAVGGTQALARDGGMWLLWMFYPLIRLDLSIGGWKPDEL